MIIASRMCPLVGQDECIFIYIYGYCIFRIHRLQDSQLRSQEYADYKTASNAATCVVNRVMQLQDRLSEDMRMPEGRIVLFTHVQSL